MTVLYFDCFSGVSGDMVLGALIDAGVPLAEIRRALGSLAIDPDAVWTEPVVRAERTPATPEPRPTPGKAGVLPRPSSATGWMTTATVR